MNDESQRAGMGAILAAAIGLLAVLAILVANRGSSVSDTTGPVRGAPSEPVRGVGWSERGAGESGAGERPLEDGTASESAEEGGRVVPSSSHDAGSGPEGGVAREAVTVTEVAATPSASEAPPPRRRELTPEERYEAHAFLNDLVVLRIDNLRNEIATARAAGDEPTLRRLEPALEVLEEEAVRLDLRRRELERGLGRPGLGEEGEEANDEAPSEDPI